MARYTVVTPTSAPEDERRIFDSPYLPGAGLLQESLVLAAIVLVAGTILVFGVAYMVVPLVDAALFALTAVPVIAALAALLALALAVYRTLRYERRERRYLRLIDYELQQIVRAPSMQEPMQQRSYVADARKWDQLAYDMLRRYYDTLAHTRNREAAAKAMSRDVMVKAGLCNQKEWNIVNRLLQVRGIRRARKRGLIPRTFDEAWRIWQEKSAQVSGWYIDDDGTWIPKE